MRNGFHLSYLLFPAVAILVLAEITGAQVPDISGTWEMTKTSERGTTERFRWELVKSRTTIPNHHSWGIRETAESGQINSSAGHFEFRNGKWESSRGNCNVIGETLTCEGRDEARFAVFKWKITGHRTSRPAGQAIAAPVAAESEVLAFYRKVTAPGYRIGVIGPSEDRHRAFGEYPSQRTSETKNALIRLKGEGVHVPSRLWENSFRHENQFYFDGMVAELRRQLGEKDILVRWFTHFQRIKDFENSRHQGRQEQLKNAVVWGTLTGLSYWGAWFPAVLYDAKEVLFGWFGDDRSKFNAGGSSYVIADAPWENFYREIIPEDALARQRLGADEVLRRTSRNSALERISTGRTLVGGAAVFIYFEIDKAQELWLDRVPNQGDFDKLQAELPELRRDFEMKLKKAAAERTLLEAMLKYVESTRRKYPDVKDNDWWIGSSAFSANGYLFNQHFQNLRKKWPEQKVKDLELACIVFYVMADQPLQFGDKNQVERTQEAEREMVKARDLYKLAYYFLGYSGDPPVTGADWNP